MSSRREACFDICNEYIGTSRQRLAAYDYIQEAPMTETEKELAQLLITSLQLEDKTIDSIDPEAPLFGSYDTGWGLDSIDALEIALAIQQKYGVEMRAEDENSRQAFSSLRSLRAYIDAQKHTDKA